MTIKKIIIAEEFSKYPGLRYEKLSPGSSAEELRDNIIIPFLKKYESVEIDLDGNEAQYLPSFLEECFAGLVRKLGMKKSDFSKKIILKSDNKPELIEFIMFYVSKECKND